MPNYLRVFIILNCLYKYNFVSFTNYFKYICNISQKFRQFRINKNSKFSFNFNPWILGMDFNSINLYQFVVQIFRTRYRNWNIQLCKFIQDPARSLRFRDTLYIRIRWSRRIRREERRRRKMRIAEMDRCLELESYVRDIASLEASNRDGTEEQGRERARLLYTSDWNLAWDFNEPSK